MGGTNHQDFAPPSKASQSDPPRFTIRLYQIWKGRNKFLCGGRLIFGPDGKSVILSTVLIGGPALIFCLKMYLRLPQVDFLYGRVVLIIGLVLTFLDLLFLFMTAATDPGIVPRNSRPIDADGADSVVSIDWAQYGTPSFKLPRTRDVFVNGHTVRVKYCDTCMLYRPPRASHCSICNNCVQRFDHHCPWVGQCIGVRNYRTFYMFVSTSTMLCIYVFTFSLLNLTKEPGSLWRAMSRDIISVTLIVYCFISVWFVGGLTAFHFFLISTNQTTYENFRYRYDRKENPYSRGMMNNIKETLLSKSVPSMVNFREWVAQEDESSVVDSISRRYFGDIVKPNGKTDLELGKPPSFLQNLDYNGIDDSLKKGKGGNVNLDPYFFTTDQEGSIDDDDGTEFSSQRSNISDLSMKV